MQKEELEYLRRRQKIIEEIVRRQLFAELYVLDKPKDDEELKRRIKYFAASVGVELWREDNRTGRPAL